MRREAETTWLSCPRPSRPVGRGANGRRRRAAGSAEPRKRLITTAAGWAAAEVEAALTVPADPGAAAFFDVDNTMMQGASIYYFARGLARRKYVTTGDMVRFAWKQLKFRVVAAEHGGDVTAAKAAALAFVEGWKVEELERLSEEIFDELMADRIWSGTHALARLHLDAGQRVWLVTAAPVELGRIIAQRLGLTGALGTVAEIRDGEYTGRLVGDMLHGPAKAEAITRARRRRGARPGALLGVQRLGQRHADAVAGRPCGRGQPRLGAAPRGPPARLGDCATSAPGARPRRSRCRRRWAPASWPAPPWPGSRCTGAAAAAAA